MCNLQRLLLTIFMWIRALLSFGDGRLLVRLLLRRPPPLRAGASLPFRCGPVFEAVRVLPVTLLAPMYITRRWLTSVPHALRRPGPASFRRLVLRD